MEEVVPQEPQIQEERPEKLIVIASEKESVLSPQDFERQRLEQEYKLKELVIKEKARAEESLGQTNGILKKSEMHFQLEMRRLELQAQNNNNNNSNSLSKIDVKKFPQYRQGDCPESFERACWDFGIKDEKDRRSFRGNIFSDASGRSKKF